MDGEIPDFSDAARFGTIFRVHQWSEDFAYGRSSREPLKTFDEWAAPFVNGADDAIGVFRVWRPTPGAPAEEVGYNNDAKVAGVLLNLDPSSTLIEDPRTGGWFALKEGLIVGLNEAAVMEAPRPVPPAELMPIISERVARSIVDSAGLDGAAGGGGPLEDRRPWIARVDPIIVGGVAVALIGAAGAIIVLRRSRIHADS